MVNQNRDEEKQRLVELLKDADSKSFNAICVSLDDYYDQFAQNLLESVIAPPCKPGDTVWMLMDDSHAILPVNIWIIEIYKDTTWFEGNREDGMREFFHTSDFGKTVFLTREEAVAALERMQND